MRCTHAVKETGRRKMIERMVIVHVVHAGGKAPAGGRDRGCDGLRF